MSSIPTWLVEQNSFRMAEANAVRPQSSKSAAFSIPYMVIDRHPFAALHESAVRGQVPHEKIACLDCEVGRDVARCHDCFPYHFGDDRYSQTWASSRARARIWFLAACSRSAIDRLSGGPSVPTLTRPDISPRDEENVNVNDPRPSASKRTVSTLHTPALRKKGRSKRDHRGPRGL